MNELRKEEGSIIFEEEEILKESVGFFFQDLLPWSEPRKALYPQEKEESFIGSDRATKQENGFSAFQKLEISGEIQWNCSSLLAYP